MKQKFIDYCKGKVKDLGETRAYEDGIEDAQMYRVVAVAEQLREFSNVRIVANEDTGDWLTAIDENNNIVICTPMLDELGYLSMLEFKYIDTEAYNDILEHWDDLQMDDYFIE